MQTGTWNRKSDTDSIDTITPFHVGVSFLIG